MAWDELTGSLDFTTLRALYAAASCAPRTWCARSTGASPRAGRTTCGSTSSRRRTRWRRPGVSPTRCRHRRRSTACPAPSRTTSTCRACRPPSRSRRRAALPRAPARPCSACSMPAPSSSARPTWTSWPSAWSACARPYGVARNAFDAAFVPGGSSSGSGVAVGAGLVAFALGNDAAGSGRVPAAFNNVVGVKPTPGLVSNTAVVGGGTAKSLETISVFALTVDDGMHVLRLIAGYDPDDLFSRTEARFCDLAPQPAPTRFRFAVPSARDLVFFGDARRRAAVRGRHCTARKSRRHRCRGPLRRVQRGAAAALRGAVPGRAQRLGRGDDRRPRGRPASRDAGDPRIRRATGRRATPTAPCTGWPS